MSDPVQPHRRQPTRLCCPWDFSGKNTGVGCHFLLQCMKVKSESEVSQLCLTRNDPMDCNLAGSSIHWIFQARVPEWDAIAFSPTALMYFFSYFEAVCCSMSSSNCFFLTYIQISQEAGKVVWYSHLLKNFPQFVVIHTVKKAEIDVFLELSCFFNDPTNVGNLISGSSAFSKTSLNIWKFTVHVLLKPGLENFELLKILC